MIAAGEFWTHPAFVAIGVVAGFLGLYEFVRYQLGWKHGYIYQLLQSRSKSSIATQPDEQDAVAEPAQTVDLPEIIDRTGNAEQQPTATETADWIKRVLVHRYNGYGDDARFNYFYERLEASKVTDSLHRTAFLNLQNRPEFDGLAEGLKTWCKIGFDTIIDRKPTLRREETMNRLYAALLKVLQQGEFHVANSREFAYAWAELVREYRSDGF